MSQHTSRRSFLKGTLTAGLAVAAAPGILRSARAGEQKVRLALIGTGGIGGTHIKNFGPLGIDVPCICDVDSSHHGHALKEWPKAKCYQDYREMLEKEKANFDAVAIGVPDHHHFPATIMAMKLGKHVYTQKPLTHTVWEARELTKAAKKYKVATQMGNQGHANPGWRMAYEWIKAGSIGAVTEVHTWTNRPIWPQGLPGLPKGSDPIPKTLDWDCWIGPAPMRTYKEKYSETDKRNCYHPFSWRGWWDFGAGALGDMACHTLDGLFWAMEPGYPTSIEPVICSEPVTDCFPNKSKIKFVFPSNSWRHGFDAYWYDGGLKPEKPEHLEKDRVLPRTGSLFIGSRASILCSGDYGDTVRIIPEVKMKEIGKAPELLERSPGHYKEFIMACSGEKPIDFPKSNFSYAGPFTESILLGNVALRLGKKLEWDGANLQVTNAPEAQQLIHKAYRSGWDLA